MFLRSHFSFVENAHREGLSPILGPKGSPHGSKTEPEWNPKPPEAMFADIEFDMVFIVRTPHQGVPGEVQKLTFCGLFAGPLRGGVTGGIF